MGTTEYKLLLRTSTACTALSSKGDGRGEKRLGVCVGDSENYSLWIKVVKCPNGKWRACKTCGSLNPDDSPPLDDSITEPRLPVSAPAEQCAEPVGSFRQSIRSQSTVVPAKRVYAAASRRRGRNKLTHNYESESPGFTTSHHGLFYKKHFWVANAAVQFEGLSPIG
ncbi:hypothetical protein OOU_Y34scaffold00528g21 [Pyricularia oryzae Y34]|uniref:Uncharacterized protein n=1 Tax=Pyricularia oryzae (strain Y34) TaxID=1143189 RepID=A0AA97NYQ0_PYRO3|nr:hypothetical protein OOU_Y34scaffold00528g21 [Pyricularia oryzae Y34]